jgi:hypothetical protein
MCVVLGKLLQILKLLRLCVFRGGSPQICDNLPPTIRLQTYQVGL